MRKLITLTAFAFSLFAQAVTVEITATQQPICSHALGTLTANANGGVAPYTYAWNNGSTYWTITGLPTGTYSVTVMDANGEEATAEYTLEAAPDWGNIGIGSHFYCDGQEAYGHVSAGFFALGTDPFSNDLSAAFPLTIDGDVTPFFNPNMSPAWLGNGYIIHTGVPTEVEIAFTDATGCPGTLFGETVGPIDQWPAFTAVEVAPSCGPTPNGSITVLRTGGVNASLHGPDNTTYWDTGLDQEEVFHEVPPGGYWLVQNTRTPATNSFNWDYLPAAQCGDSIYVVVPDVGPACGELSGRIFIDADENCVLDGGEIGAGHQVLILEPGPRYVSTDFSGNYSAQVPLGTYTVVTANEVLQPVCPAEATVSSLAVPVELDVPVLGAAGPMPDLWATLVSGPARPGFEMLYSMRAHNLNYGASGVVTATFTADPLTPIIGADPAPDMISAGSVMWTLPDVAPYAMPWFQVRVQVPADVALIGTMLSAGWTLSSANLDLNPANNSTTYNTLVTGSYDPNDKLAVTSTRASEELYFIDQDEWVDYTIRFQNTGTDTAFTVLVTDTLASTLDPSSLLVGAASHPFTWDLGYGNVLRCHFDDILLPDSNVNELASHGQVTFRIKPREPLMAGTQINNSANIFFDFNPPVITPTATLMAEFSTGLGHGPTGSPRQLTLSPNPVNDLLMVGAAEGKIHELQIFAMDGRTVYTGSLNSTTMTIATGSFPEGLYILAAEFANGRSERFAFSVLHP